MNGSSARSSRGAGPRELILRFVGSFVGLRTTCSGPLVVVMIKRSCAHNVGGQDSLEVAAIRRDRGIPRPAPGSPVPGDNAATWRNLTDQQIWCKPDIAGKLHRRSIVRRLAAIAAGERE